MRGRYTFLPTFFTNRTAHSNSLLIKGSRLKSTSIDFFGRSSILSSVMQRDFEQYHEAKVTFDAKLVTLFQRARELSENHHYKASILELRKIIALTSKMDTDDLAHNQILLLSDAYAALASILRVGSSDDEAMALRCCDNAIRLNPSHSEALAIRRSILSEHAVLPTDGLSDFTNDESDKKTHNST